MSAYYNEIEPFAAEWLRNLMAAGLIADGEVDQRSIKDVSPDDLRGFTQAHFFAGIGGWSHALRLAGWPDDEPAWTGSCPCQPFSVAGSRRGTADQRHLWPEFRRLIAVCRPPIIFGEQVAAATEWLGIVRSDLETMEYAVAVLPIEAASAGAEHFRDRYWFVADSNDAERRPAQSAGDELSGAAAGWNQSDGDIAKRSTGPVADDTSQRSDGSKSAAEPARRNRVQNAGRQPLVNAESLGWGEGWTEHEFRSRGFTAAVASIDGCQYVECPDGKWRRLPPPRVRWLVNGLPARVATLRALGNAIDPRPAAEFIAAYRECSQ